MRALLRGHPRLALVLVNVVLLFLVALGVELAGRIVALVWPAYEVVFLQPDPLVGWKHLPDFRYTWTGTHWYAADFSVPIQSNSHGFRDLERSQRKGEGVVRVVLLGDSMVEALQVPLEKTAGQLLERRLNAEAAPRRFEVLNFGVSGYSVGQYLLVFEEYASRFEPDYVFAFVSGIQLTRTVSPIMIGALAGSPLRVRPTFALRDDRLIRQPAAELAELMSAHEALDRHPARRIRRRNQSLLGILAGEAGSALARLRGAGRSARPGPFARLLSGRIDETTLRVNLEVLSELARAVGGLGARFVLVDASRYFAWDAAELAAKLRRFCVARGLGYVALSDDLLAAKARGVATRWRHDSHLNEAGNELFANALYRWMASQGMGSPAAHRRGADPARSE